MLNRTRHLLHRIRLSRSSSSSPRRSPFSSHFQTLRARYPLADPPSLLAAFLILHELTAIVPLGLGFWGLKSLGAGERAVDWALAEGDGASAREEEEEEDGSRLGWGKREVRKWVGEGEARAERIGRRYGVLGYTKETTEEREGRRANGITTGDVKVVHATGDVANLAGAYVLVKLLMPIRILVSLRLAPPLANLIVRRFKKLRDVGSRYLRKG